MFESAETVSFSLTVYVGKIQRAPVKINNEVIMIQGY